MENTPEDENESNTLEGPDVAETGSVSPSEIVTNQNTPKKKPTEKIRGLITHLNIYLILFIFILVLSAGIVFIGIQKNKKASVAPTVTTQPLDKQAVDKLNGNVAKVGDPKQTLSIESNTVFSGKVLVRDSLDVAGTIKVGGSLSLPGLTVSGTSSFDQIQSNRLSVAGDTTIQGQLTIQKGLTVSGGATFNGPISAPQLTVQNLQLSGDLQITHHISAGGVTPGKIDGSALGSGGTSSVSGSDTAGSVAINTGGGPGVGCFITLNFTQKFNSTPHITITPVGSAAGGLNYYINRSTSSFSICTTNAAPAGQSFGFDYVALGS